MKLKEPGVLPESDVYFHTPSVSSRELFLTLLCAGKYGCTPEYLVRRSGYESGLLLTVLEGEGFAEIGGRRVSLRRGDSLGVSNGFRAGLVLIRVHEGPCYLILSGRKQ